MTLVGPASPAGVVVTRRIPNADRFETRRVLVGYAYANNGNTHNPTPRYRWHLLLDGRVVDEDSRKGPLVIEARRPGSVKRYSS